MAKEVFILRAKIDELDIENHKIGNKFPKAERHVLAADMRRVMDDIVRLEERASRMQLSERRRGQRPMRTWELLQTLDAELGLYKRKLGKAEALGYFQSQGRGTFAKLAGLAQEVGALLGKWILTVEKQAFAPAARALPSKADQGKLI